MDSRVGKLRFIHQRDWGIVRLLPIHKQIGQFLFAFFTSILVIFSLSACDLLVIPDEQSPVVNNPDNFQVNALFTDFYIFLGGEGLMGPIISPLAERDGKFYQYTLNGLMVHDPSAPPTALFKLFPIGKELGIFEKAVPAPEQSDPWYVNGHIVGQPFRQFYNKQLSQYYGAPLTEMFYNRLRRRYEQYFEGVAFYQMIDSGEVGLLTYGALLCGQNCKQIDAGNSVLDYSHQIAPVFRDLVNQTGIRFSGFPISELFFFDGNWMQVFQNIVLVADSSDHPESARLFSVAKSLGIMPENPLPPSGSKGMNFYSAMDGLGYDIPTFFWDYLVAHGGLQVAGAPISHFGAYTENAFRQCFENLCLIQDNLDTEFAQIYPDQLGYQFLGLLGHVEAPPQPADEPERATIILRVEEGHPTVRSDQPQEIQITVLRNGFPVSGVALELTITMPDNSTQNFALPETGADGKSSLLLPVIQAENASVILYQVCVVNQEQANFCYEDSFAIWNQP